VRDFLVRPLTAEEIHGTIVNIHRVDQARRAVIVSGEAARPLGTVITVAGFKGGIGKSTVASNVAVSLAQQTQQHVVLTDFDLQFGDAAVMLDLVPTHSVEHVAKNLDRLDPQGIQGYLATHPSRLKVLAAPTTPDAAEEIGDGKVAQILALLAATNDFVVVDTAPHLDDFSATAMDLSTIVLVVVVPEVPCIRRTKAAMTLMQSWGYTRDKVKLVVNRAQDKGEISIPEIEQALDYPVYARIPDDRSVTRSISLGTPVAMSDPKGRAGRAVHDLTRSLTGLPKPSRMSLLRRRPKTAPPAPQQWLSSPPAARPPDDAWLNGGSYDPFAGNRWAESEPAPATGRGPDFGWPVRGDAPSGARATGETAPAEETLSPWLSARVRER
jgi:pilus assembly protein CpaE